MFKEIIGLTESFEKKLKTTKKNQVEKYITRKYNNQNKEPNGFQ